MEIAEQGAGWPLEKIQLSKKKKKNCSRKVDVNSTNLVKTVKRNFPGMFGRTGRGKHNVFVKVGGGNPLAKERKEGSSQDKAGTHLAEVIAMEKTTLRPLSCGETN